MAQEIMFLVKLFNPKAREDLNNSLKTRSSEGQRG
jgi:hypothetical protein